MGKGDKKTKRGKLFKGSYGIKRRRNSDKPAAAAVIPGPKPKEVKAVKEAVEVKEVKAIKEEKETKPVKEIKAPKEAATAKAVKAPAAKKEPKPKKQDTEE